MIQAVTSIAAATARAKIFLLCLLAWASAPYTFAEAKAVPHALWADILQTYVSPGPQDVNRVDYSALKASDADREKLDIYIEAYSELDFGELTREERLAAWVNLYNAVTVRYIVGKYPVGTINPWYSRGPWRSIKVRAGGEEVSLHQIEHEILRKQWPDEPRLHYALNCASIGCPDLKTTPWRAETLEADLSAAARAYINHPRGVSPVGGSLRVSSIYKWYKEDFGGSETALIGHFLDYAEPSLAETIRKSPTISDYTYDWSLNGIEASS